MLTKTCTKCKEAKGAGEFSKCRRNKNGLMAQCKSCVKRYQQANSDKLKEANKRWYQANPVKARAQRAKWRQANPDKNPESARKWQRANPDKAREVKRKWRLANADKTKEQHRQWRQANPDKVRELGRRYTKERRQTDPLFKLICNLRRNTARVKSRFDVKSRTAQLLGCSFEEARMHLILTALTNYGFYVEGCDWHVDHIVPLSSATSEAEAIALCHYTNLQYLTPEDNIAKSDRLDWSLNNAS